MKVLHLGKYYPPHRGGMETHLATLAAGLQRYMDVEIVVAADERASSHEFIDGLSVHRAGNLGVVASTPICPSMFGLLGRSGADLVHIHHPHPLAMLAYLRSATRKPAIVSYHSDVVRQQVLGKVISPLIHATLRRSAAILVASDEYLSTSDVLARYREKCRLVPYGIDIENRPARSERAIGAIRNRFGPRLVLSVGRLVRYKGLDYLLGAMPQVDAHLVIIGSGAQRADLERLVGHLNVERRVTFLGDVQDTQPYYDACDVFVLPSVTRNEAFGIVQLEALAAGKPVVNTAIDSGVTFASPHGETGITVPPRNAGALADAINMLLRNPMLRERMGRAAAARVRALFSAETMVRQTVATYSDVLRNS